MKNYSKKNITQQDIKPLVEKYRLSPLEASIFARRGITKGNDVLYFLENDTRFMHQCFEFNSMEDAVERINQAIDENEKVLIFGDKDVDGVSSTAILYGYLKSRGLDVQWRLPVGEDSYGLSMDAVNDFASEYGSLIITVDCGISNNLEISHAVELGIDVIVTDHHNPPENLPDAQVIIDPKLEDSGYSFKDISGAAVAFKLVQALRFSRFELYGQDFCLFNIEEKNDVSLIQCLKIRNLIKKDYYELKYDGTPLSIYSTKLPEFLSGQQIFCWNLNETQAKLREIFGSGIDFQMLELKDKIAEKIPPVRGKTLSEVKNLSRIAFYSDSPLSENDGFYNLFVTFASKIQDSLFPNLKKDAEMDLELVAIAALADIMPMKDENRIFVKSALNSMNKGIIRPGLSELFARNDFSGKKITSTDLSWKIVPQLNAAGRLGKSYLSLELLINPDPAERSQTAEQISKLNDQRKIFGNDAELFTLKQAEENFEKYGKKIIPVFDERINRGITGILCSKLMQKYNVPAIAVTLSEDRKTAVGSMRSCRSLVATRFLDAFGKDFFINHGGHDCAAGFSFDASKINIFMEKALELSRNIKLSDEETSIDIDAEIPSPFITPKLLEIIDRFEPYGEMNKELVFISKKLPVQDAILLGKTEKQHLKLIFDCGKYKFPAMFFWEGERLNRDFKCGDNLNVIFSVSRNYYNGNVTPQMILTDAEKSD